MILKEAPKEFSKNGHEYSLIERKGDVCIYKGVCPKRRYFFYEVFILQIREVGEILKRSDKYAKYTHFEKTPSNEDFGYIGWSYPTLDKAIAKFKEVCHENARNSPKNA